MNAPSEREMPQGQPSTFDSEDRPSDQYYLRAECLSLVDGEASCINPEYPRNMWAVRPTGGSSTDSRNGRFFAVELLRHQATLAKRGNYGAWSLLMVVQGMVATIPKNAFLSGNRNEKLNWGHEAMLSESGF